MNAPADYTFGEPSVIARYPDETFFMVALPVWSGVTPGALGPAAQVVVRDGRPTLAYRLPNSEPESVPAPAKPRGSLRQRVERARCRGILRLEHGGAA